MLTPIIANTYPFDRIIDKPRTLKYIDAHDIGIEIPVAMPWMVSKIDSSGIKLARKAPIIRPSATIDTHSPIRKKAIPTWIYSLGVLILRLRTILTSVIKLIYSC